MDTNNNITATKEKDLVKEKDPRNYLPRRVLAKSNNTPMLDDKNRNRFGAFSKLGI